MSILPPNKPTKTVDTPKNFFIYGATMNGKSYLASEFPNPLFLDTDGNASANPYPSIQLRNVRGKNGKISESVVDQFDQIITELQTTKHGFETVVLDVIDDIVVMIEQYICDREGVETIGDIGYGKGYAAFSNIFNALVIELKALPINVIYVSRIATREENNVSYEIPSLKEKHVNIVNGNCDYMIQAKKVGKNYLRIVKEKRKNYQRDNIDDERILEILDTLTGAFERSQRTNKKKQDEIVKKLEEETEEKLVGVSEEETSTTPVEDTPQPTKETPAPVEKKQAPTNNTDGVVRNRPRPQV
ncbi:AAA domain-containing protein [Aerococcus sp. 150760007-1]|uniref:AAA family ATPase n=1 Tax=Aerococcus urinaeequi TaxID=51665 RepID=A0ABR5ZXU2_9LACT|nr:AAA family ATPase [Aerococcus urinaeequi]MBA5746558.1 AAA family ATPase [Aerococcus urinaeequi]MBA5829391.1 AAA family ATPase [Aerococcus urinaeequi]MBA5860246.1 AAA family ATPase [Aerococcus urinaeequi]